MSAARPKPTHDSERDDAATARRGAADAAHAATPPACSHCGAEAGASCNADAPVDADACDRAAADNDGGPIDSDAARIAQLEKAVADAGEQRMRLIAEYQTAQRRALESEVRARGAGVADAARHVFPVLDNLELALGKTDGMSAEKAIEGLSMLRAELSKALEKAGIARIAPKPGEEFDPHQHEAVMRQPADGVDRDCISVVFQPGYRLGETVLRPAKVAVAP